MQHSLATLSAMAEEPAPAPHARHSADGCWFESADGRLRLQVQTWLDDRGPPSQGLTLWRRAAPNAQPLRLARWTSHGLHASAEFSGPDALIVEQQIDRRGQAWRLWIDAEAQTFTFHPNERPMPLDELDAWLNPPFPAAGAGLPPPSTPLTPLRRAARVFTEGLSLLGAGLLTLGGGWMLLAADSAADRWTGLFGLVFFGACAGLSVRDLRRWR
jgi:hypothetical protein